MNETMVLSANNYVLSLSHNCCAVFVFLDHFLIRLRENQFASEVAGQEWVEALPASLSANWSVRACVRGQICFHHPSSKALNPNCLL